MDIVITEWAFQSYLDLKHKGAFTMNQYHQDLRPSARKLSNYPHDPFFKDSKKWGPAQDKNGLPIPHGFKLKWHNMGNGRVQLRCLVVIWNNTAFLCDSYNKTSDSLDKRKCSRLKNKIQDISLGHFYHRGLLK